MGSQHRCGLVTVGQGRGGRDRGLSQPRGAGEGGEDPGGAQQQAGFWRGSLALQSLWGEGLNVPIVWGRPEGQRGRPSGGRRASQSFCVLREYGLALLENLKSQQSRAYSDSLTHRATNHQPLGAFLPELLKVYTGAMCPFKNFHYGKRHTT